MADYYDSGMSPDQGLAEYITRPIDVEDSILKLWGPYGSKAMALGNLSDNDILDIFDFATISNIQARSKLTRFGKSKHDRENFTNMRAFMKPHTSLGRGGFAVKRITESTQTINTNQSTGGAKRGLIGGLLGRGGNE